VFATRTTTKVFATQQDRSTLVARLIQDKIGIQRTLGVIHARFAVVQITKLVKQIRAKTRTLDGLQKLLWNDQIRVDVFAIKRSNQTLMSSEFIHDSYLKLRTSTK